MVPSRAKRVWGVVHISSKIRARKRTVNYFRFRKTRVYIGQSVCTKWNNGFFGGRTTASSRIMVLFIDCEVVHAWHIYVCFGVGRKLGSSSAETKAPGSTLRAKARPTQDGRLGLQKRRKRNGRCGANRFRRKTWGIFIIESKVIFKKNSQSLITYNYIFTRVNTVLLY